MALRLRVISDHRRPLGERGMMTFGAAGGTIGRSSDNDWVLPDPQRYVSAHHARIRFSQGQFELEDTSTNGLYVNDDEQPVKEYGSYRLKHGDVLRIGEYEVAVALDRESADEQSDPDTWSGASTLTAVDPVPTRINDLQGLARAAQTDLGAVLNLNELLMTESSSGRRLGPVNAYGQSIVPAPSVPKPSAASDADPASAPGPGEEALARRLERLARAATRAQEARSAHLPAPPEVQTGLQAFCRGAGLDVRLLPADAQARLLQLVGQLFREALVGLKDLERARGQIRDRFHVTLAADPEDPRPSLVRSTVEELLVAVLSQAESRSFDAVQWIRDAIDAAKAHELATAEALRAAFVEFIDRFDPAELEARFDRAARRTKATGNAQSRNWSLFTEFYRNLTEMPPNQLPHTFLEAFASAYRKALESGSQRP
jgi:type VI secretion system protein